MVVIFFIFGGNGCRQQVRRDPVQGDVGAPPGVGVNNLVKHVIITVEDAGGLKLRGAGAQVFHAGQVLQNDKILNHGHRAHDDNDGNAEEKQANQPAGGAAQGAPGAAGFTRAAGGRFGLGGFGLSWLWLRRDCRAPHASGLGVLRAGPRRGIGRGGHPGGVQVSLFHVEGQGMVAQTGRRGEGGGVGVGRHRAGDGSRRRDGVRQGGCRWGRRRHRLTGLIPAAGKVRLAGGMMRQRLGGCLCKVGGRLGFGSGQQIIGQLRHGRLLCLGLPGARFSGHGLIS